MTTDVHALRERLQHVYWIGGGSGAGKSTVAHRMAAQHGLRLYPTDDTMADHARRTTRDNAPLLHAFMAMDMDERWVNRTPQTMLETFPWFHGEGFNLIIEDLLGLGNDPGVLVEGFRLLPRLVKPLLSSPTHAVWLLPTPSFRQAVMTQRSEGFLAKTGDTKRALANLMERDRLFTDRLREEATGMNLQVIDIDNSLSEDDLVRRLTRRFNL